MKIRGGDIRAAGIADGPVMGVALRAMPKAVKQLGRERALERLAEVAKAPADHLTDPHFGPVANRLIEAAAEAERRFVERDAPAPMVSFCEDAEAGALEQMHNSLRLPSALRGALMPDAHRGYGLPIGGVLETVGTVIPYAVGVDIACRMKLSVVDLDPSALDDPAKSRLLQDALVNQTAFGVGGRLRRRADHAAIHDPRWKLTSFVQRLRDRAWEQMGSSGSGNHFC